MRADDKQLLDQLDSEPDLVDHTDEIKQILEISDRWEAPTGKSKEAAWDMLESQISKPKSNGRFIWYAAASIALAILAIAVFFMPAEMVKHDTLAGQTKVIELPDGSRVTMNAESQISYRDNFESDRMLELKGEAFFEVQSGSKFAVKSGMMTTEVLGTSFNVYARANDYQVECVSGKVMVTDAEAAQVYLGQNERVVASSGVLGDMEPLSSAEKSSWREGKFYFKNASLINVVNEFERQFDVEVVGEIEKLKTKRYTGRFENDALESAAKQVFEPMGYSFEINNKKVNIQAN